MIKETMIVKLVLLVVCSVIAYYSIRRAKKKEINVRPLAPLEAIPEYVGRATELGRPVHFSPGVSTGRLASDMAAAHLAGFSVLGNVAELCAKYDTELNVSALGEMIPIADDVVRAAYLRQGKPDVITEGMIHFHGAGPWAWIIGLVGFLHATKPALHVHMGYGIPSDSLVYTSAAAEVGAANIGGAVWPEAIAMLAASCDYLLIGEELLAAGAAVSKAPDQLGSLRGEDIFRFILIGLTILGAFLATIGVNWMALWGL